MMLGKVVMLMMAKQKMAANTASAKEKYWREFEADALKGLKRNAFLAYSRSPVALWFLGTVFLLLGIAMTILVVFHTHVLFDDIDGLSYSSKLAICASTLLSGLIMLMSAKRECVRINKAEDWIYVEYTRLLRAPLYEGRYLNTLRACNIVRKGRNTFHENSLHFVLRFEFAENIDCLEVAETTDLQLLKKKYIQICTYLALPLPPAELIRFVDESVITLEWKKSKANQQNAAAAVANKKYKEKEEKKKKKEVLSARAAAAQVDKYNRQKRELMHLKYYALEQDTQEEED